MLNRDECDRIADYFEAWELVELLRLPIEDIIEYFEDEIEDKLAAINEVLGIESDEDDGTQEGI
jgi:hypothetical protein